MIVKDGTRGAGGRPLALYESCNTEFACGIFSANGLRMFAVKGNVGPNTKSKESLPRLITEAAKALRTFAALLWIKPFSAVTSATLYKPAKML